MLFRLSAMAGLTSFMLIVVGCAGSTDKRAVISAKGKVTQKGQPVGGALVVFHCLDKGRENEAKPVATTKDDGTFVLTTFNENDGAPAGEYGVTIVWIEKPKAGKMSLGGEGGGGGADKLNGRYGDPRTPKLKATVSTSQPNDFAFEVP